MSLTFYVIPLDVSVSFWLLRFLFTFGYLGFLSPYCLSFVAEKSLFFLFMCLRLYYNLLSAAGILNGRGFLWVCQIFFFVPNLLQS